MCPMVYDFLKKVSWDGMIAMWIYDKIFQSFLQVQAKWIIFDASQGSSMWRRK